MEQKLLASGGFNQLRRCRYGYMLYNVHDLYVGRSLDLYGEFSEGEVELFRQILRPGHVVLDVGANVGDTLFFAQAVGGRGRVHALEPQRIVYQTLCANLALNSITNVFTHQAAAGSAVGTLLVPPLNYTETNNFGGLSLGTYAAGEAVAVVPLDRLELPSCRFIKVDVEGMELEVLRGAAHTIGKHKPILYVESDRRDAAQELMRFIEALGYVMYWHITRLFNPENVDHNPDNVFGGTVSVNLLCVHQSARAVIEGPQRARSGDPHPIAR